MSPPRRNDPALSATEKVIDPTGVLLSAASAPDLTAYLDGLAPQDRVYLGLREALKRYRALETSGAWQPLTPAMALEPGASNEHVRRLRHALVLMGDLPADADVQSTHYSDDVAAAVRRFQKRNGIGATGTVDAATRTAYNVPPATRIRQIHVNMERRRWMPTELGANHIFVNLPSYTLDVIEDGKSVLDMRVVIGKPTWPTPVFSDMMEYLEFNPYWTVPPGILKKEVLPKMRSNPGYAAAAGLKVYYNGKPVNPSAVDWSSAGAGYSFRQDPGERNALGRIKFMFPNQYAVYLHDTPSKALFGRSTRAFSHGCIRVEKPMDLAVYVLNRNGENWSRQRIDRVINAQRNSSVRLSKPLPVHLAYFTVWLDSDGSVQFRNDVYGRDTTLERTLSASAG
jgi:murein L,D-transpeptidase YcbB/YkuD